MDAIELTLIVAAAEVVNCLVLYLIISSATNTERRSRYDLAAVLFLAKIARAQGVPEDQIKEVLSNVPEIPKMQTN